MKTLPAGILFILWEITGKNKQIGSFVRSSRTNQNLKSSFFTFVNHHSTFLTSDSVPWECKGYNRKRVLFFSPPAFNHYFFFPEFSFFEKFLFSGNEIMHHILILVNEYLIRLKCIHTQEIRFDGDE